MADMIHIKADFEPVTAAGAYLVYMDHLLKGEGNTEWMQDDEVAVVFFSEKGDPNLYKLYQLIETIASYWKLSMGYIYFRVNPDIQNAAIHGDAGIIYFTKVPS